MTELSFDTTSRFLETANGRLHYHEAGSGPALLLLHGSGPGVTGWANFAGNLPLFARHFRTIILDAPGYGKSDPVDGDPVTVARDAVLALMDGLRIDRAHVIGNSYGGIVGGHLAAAHPDRVLRYITIGGIGFNITSTFPNEGLTRLVDFIENPTRDNIVAWLESMVFDKSIITDELIDMRYKAALEPVTMASSRKMYTRSALDFIAQSMTGPAVSQRIDYLGRIQAPTLITWGRDDKVSPLDGALLPMRVIPNAELHVFPRCGHWAMIECKERFETLALGFLLGGGD
ncbi:alpha/beta fold hydrolase [Sphingobium sp. ZW T5_29]|uniref:alpha/beta fold hydrolase n=1 Tax=Sphingobium sp. ZW T5_29 TaxID=3378077 RepID=UPI00385465B4